MSKAGFKAVFAYENNKELVIMSVKRAFPRTNLQFSPFRPQSTKVPFAKPTVKPTAPLCKPQPENHRPRQTLIQSLVCNVGEDGAAK